MAIEENAYQPTDSLILPSPPLFYPLDISVHHNQLRCLISRPSPNVLYYANDHDIFRLDLSTRRRELITPLPFSVRCLVAGYGWVCVGGPDHGQFAAIKVDDGCSTSSSRSPQPYIDVDAPLSLQNDLERRASTQRHSVLPEHSHRLDRRTKPDVRPREFGGLTVNAVTLFQPPEGTDDADVGPVAILSNNDKTVKIFSLPQSRLLSTLEFLFHMNHASIRPDGEILAAVGDDAYVYFYRRAPSKARPPRKGVNGRASSSSSASLVWKWDMVQRVELVHAPDPNDDAWFATAFSPSGQYCAVASQGGTVTIFDAQLIADPDHDAVIETLTSSRPFEPSLRGAIRSICFSPAPWDLLVCVEQAERICVFDARSGFRLRQVMTLDHRSGTSQSVELLESQSNEAAIDPRLRNSMDWNYLRRYGEPLPYQEEEAAAEFATDYMESSAERRRLQRQGRGESPEPFTVRERHILEMLRTSRDRMAAREHLPMIDNHPATRDFRNASHLPSIDAGSAPTGSLGPPSAGASSSNTPSMPAVRNHFRERNAELDQARARPYDPRRRTSVVLAHDGSGAPGAAAHELPELTRTLSPPRTQMNPLDPLSAIEAVLSSSQLVDELGSALERQPGEITSRTASWATALRELERMDQARLISVRRRDRNQALHVELEGVDRSDGGSPRRDEPDLSLGTAGCCMSADGKKLYIGTEGGIFEYSVNLQSRRQFPRIAPR